MWSNIEFLTTLGKYATWVAATAGLLAALVGLIAVVATYRVSDLKDVQEALVRPRHVDKATEMKVISSLDKYKKGALTVESTDNAEAAAFADSLAGTLKAAGWKVHRVRGAIYNPERYGIFLTTTRKMPADAKTMYRALQEARFPIEIWWIEEGDPGWEIRVALRPRNFLVWGSPS
jgi:hypothetical protein